MEIQWSVSKSLSDEAKDHVIPLVSAVQGLAETIRRRVSGRGETADGGRFRPLVPRRRKAATPKLRRFYRTGQLWKSLQVRATEPGRARVVFRGKRENHGQKNALTNPQLAWILQSRESAQILAPNAQERAEFAGNVATLAEGQWLRRTPEVRGNHKAARQDARAARAVAKAKALRAKLQASGVTVEGRSD